MLGSVVAPIAASAETSNRLETLDGDFVIDTASPDGSHNHDAVDVPPEVLAEAEATIGDLFHQPAPAVGAAQLDDFAFSALAVTSGLSVSYTSPAPPADVQTAIQAAINQWNTALQPVANAPVAVQVSWTSLQPGVLGAAGPNGSFKGYDGATKLGDGVSWYAAGLTNVLLGKDYNGGAEPEIKVILNSDMGSQWYTGTGTPPGGTLDLRSVMAHEIAHGLGFLGSGGSSGTVSSPPYIYDRQVTYNGTPIPNLQDSYTALRSNNLRTGLSNAITAKTYAPTSWQPGSSLSHIDPGGAQYGALMNPALGAGETRRSPDAWTLGVLGRLGWPIKVNPLVPDITSVAGSSSTATLTWTYDLKKKGLPPDRVRLWVIKDGVGLSSVTIGAGRRDYLFAGLNPSTTYTLAVASDTGGRIGPAATINVTTSAGAGGTTTPTPSPNPIPVGSYDPNQPAFVDNTGLDHQISRVFQAFFLRYPDQQGFNYWLKRRAEGASVLTMYNSFATGTEFVQRYGSLNNAQFVELVYQNIFGRAADDSGRVYWNDRLNRGLPRASMMAEFGESSEFVRKTKTVAPYGSNEGQIRRLYQAFFLRAPDASGLDHWTGVLDNGGSLSGIAEQFAAGTEFQKRYGSLNNAQFVNLVYNNVLGRSPDLEGYSFWKGRLDMGTSRGQLMVGFSESPENIQATGTLP